MDRHALESLAEDRGDLVWIHQANLSKLATDIIKENNFSQFKHWLSLSPFSLEHLSYEKRITFVCVLDSISFSFWGSPKWSIVHQGQEYDGALAMIVALGRALENDEHIFEPKNLQKISSEKVAHILKGTVEIPLQKQRVHILHEIGEVVCKKFDGRFQNILLASQGDALRLLSVIINNFPSFRDSFFYDGKEIAFNKRAQLLVLDLNFLMDEKSKLKNLDKLTALADYKIPQVLRRHNVLGYCESIEKRIRSLVEIPENHPMEIAIRLNTLLAVDQITKIVQKKILHVTTTQINDYLWLEGQKKLPTDEPYHRTRTIHY